MSRSSPAQSYSVETVRADFPMLSSEVRGRKLVYLDNAASTLRPLAVIERVDQYYRNETSNVHRGAHFLSAQGTVAYEGARAIVASFVGACDPAEIVFTRGTTESVNLVATSYGHSHLRPGDEILLSELEHHSNIVPWQQVAARTGAVLKVMPMRKGRGPDDDRVGELNEEKWPELITTKTKIVAVTWCSNALGTIVPIEKIIEAAHAVGARVFIDAAQAVSHLAVDVQKLGCDFLAFSGHKLFAPYGIGVLYARAELLEAMAPYQTGGSMISEVTWEKTTWAAVPHKFEAGTPNISGAIGLGTAIHYFQSLGLDKTSAHENMLLTEATRLLSEIPGVNIIGQAEKKAAILSFSVEGAHASDIGALLDQQGIAIRAGHHCCQPLMRALGIAATARASFSFYNTLDEVHVLRDSVARAKEFF